PQREARAGGAADVAGGSHGCDHRAPPVDGRDRRQGARDGARPHRGGWCAGGADRGHRQLRSHACGVARLPRLTRAGHAAVPNMLLGMAYPTLTLSPARRVGGALAAGAVVAVVAHAVTVFVFFASAGADPTNF